ncbi:putative reverse transcriptase domain-containing protein [Tanacetum coccineum]
MPPRMRTQSAGRPAAESLGGGMGVRVGRGGRGRRPREGNDERVDDLNGQGNDQGMRANRGVEGVNGNVEGANGGAPDFSTIIAQQLYNLLPAMLAQLVPHLVTPESRMIKRYVYGLALQIHGMVAATEPKTIQNAVHISGALTDEADKNGRDDNKRTRTGNAFSTTVNAVERGDSRVLASLPCNPGRAECICFNYNCLGHLARDCRGVLRNLNRVNARNPNGEENRPNQVDANNGGQGCGNQGNQARGGAFMLGAEEARQDPNIMTGTFTLNNHFATTLFDSGADYSFVSTTFIPMLGLEPIDLGFRYEIKIASGQLVEIDKVIKGCKLEIEGHVFDIDLIHFGHGSFDVIIVMDWLSNYKAEIICPEKVVRIPLPDGKQEKDKKRSKGNFMIIPYLFLLRNTLSSRETKQNNIGFSSSEEHMVNFHHLDDARDIWLAIKARVSESEITSTFLVTGGHLLFKTKSGLDYLKLDDLYNKLRTLKLILKVDLEEFRLSNGKMAMLSIRINRFKKKAGRKMKFNNKDVARFDKKWSYAIKVFRVGVTLLGNV